MEDKQEIIEAVREKVINYFEILTGVSDEDILDYIAKAVLEATKDILITNKEKSELCDKVFNSMRRLDVIQPLIDDKTITEIMINGPQNIFVEKKGKVYKAAQEFSSMKILEDVIQSIVGRVNREVNQKSPIVDARLEDGSRVNIVLPPVALNGPIVTIRKFPERPLAMEDLIRAGSITKEIAEFLEKLVKAKYNIFISGGTGSGKTTFLNILSNYIGSDERVITIEDSAELQINNVENLVRLETRNANTEGKGQITIKDLIKSSLRMRPDRIVVGEVRGGEALDMLQAMNTGHDGSLSTGHANSTDDMLSRLETMVLSAAQLPLEAIRQQIASAIDIVIHLSRMRDRTRKVVEISEVLGMENNKIILNTIYKFQENENSTLYKVEGKLEKLNELDDDSKLVSSGINL